MSVTQYIFKPDAAVDMDSYKAIDGKTVALVRQLSIEDNETDQVEWEVVPVMPIEGREHERWIAMPHELILEGLRA